MARVVIHSPRDDKRTLVRAEIVLTSALSRSLTDFYEFKVGLATGDSVDYFGTLSTADKVLAASTVHILTGPDDLEQRIEEGESVVLDITKSGSPASIAGSVVQVEIGNVLDDPAHRLTDDIQREAADGTLEYLRDTEATTQRYSVTITDDLFSGGTTEAAAYADDSDTGTLTVSTLNTYTAFSPDIAITLTPPTTGVTYIAEVFARADLDLTTSACNGSVKIRNTTDSTDLDELTGIGATAGPSYPCTLFGQEEITEAKTYQMQFRRDTGSAGNARWRQPKIMGRLIRKES